MARSRDGLIPRPQVPEGLYAVEVLEYWTYSSHYGQKLVFLCVITAGEFAGTQIARIFNVECAPGKRKWKARRHKSFWAEYCRLMEGIINTNHVRLDEIPLRPMKGMRIEARVRVVQRNRDHIELRGGASYSVIANFVRRIEKSSNVDDEKYNFFFGCELELSPSPPPVPSPAPTLPLANARTVMGTDGSLGKNGAPNGDMAQVVQRPDLSKVEPAHATPATNASTDPLRCHRCGQSCTILARHNKSWDIRCELCGHCHSIVVDPAITEWVRDYEKAERASEKS